jgi:hypothetical protein
VFGATPRARFEGGDWSSSRPRRTPRPRFNFDGMEAVLQKVHGGGLGEARRGRRRGAVEGREARETLTDSSALALVAALLQCSAL